MASGRFAALLFPTDRFESSVGAPSRVLVACGGFSFRVRSGGFRLEEQEGNLVLVNWHIARLALFFVQLVAP